MCEKKMIDKLWITCAENSYANKLQTKMNEIIDELNKLKGE